MRYVILRDDDTNALTPVECLERLYRPFLDRGLPVNLAVIPHVRTDTTTPDGRREGFLIAKNGHAEQALPIGANRELVDYLRTNLGYRIVQHGCHHDYFEFDRVDCPEIKRRLEHGLRLLTEAGFLAPQTFVAPYDRLSRASVKAVARRFDVLSIGWFELGRLPPAWWPYYVFKKMRKHPHWRVGRTLLLSHPGCLLSCHRPYRTMLDEVKRNVESRRLTVLVTHWWEYFRDNLPDTTFIKVLHQTADYLSADQNIRVISFDDLAQGRVTLN
ncbi:MAG TPA: DUF2334 domain-containing protein [Candidatus Angelobacter sp.]|nr:DUF2334 domain-containing protein [Candidatus Angelobacter sp.]